MDQVKFKLSFGEKIMFVGKDLGIKIVLDTLMSGQAKKKLVLKFDELVQKAAVSAFYIYYVEDAILVRLKSDADMTLLVTFFTELFGKIIAEIMAKIIWNTVLDWTNKMNTGMKIEGNLIKKATVEYIPIIMSNVIGATGSLAWKWVRGQLSDAPQTGLTTDESVVQST